MEGGGERVEKAKNNLVPFDPEGKPARLNGPCAEGESGAMGTRVGRVCNRSNRYLHVSFNLWMHFACIAGMSHRPFLPSGSGHDIKCCMALHGIQQSNLLCPGYHLLMGH